MIRTWATLLAFTATPLWSDGVTSVDYDDLAGQLSGLVDFEDFTTLPEPGQAVSGPLSPPGLTIAVMLQGQVLRVKDRRDVLGGTPVVPIRASMGGKDAALAVAYHAGFGSNAAFPLGADGFAKRSGRGEGALVFVFDASSAGFALKLHADYADPLGTRPAPGPVTLSFYAASGAVIARHSLRPDHGVTEIGLRINPPAKAITLTHHDDGGIAIDDIRYSLDSLGS
ncbi:hypothetical protein [Aliiroseovarius sediminis]|uniref:hypothetical protein n=1 Tax=Aliiroseovarius sediminis TaxID=2925839 RepID=UPI001F56B626|nr:hypothetical protein [Aliiroseovarius sediminis]MCI2392922.1 hypothetical protein [Aliiroseovarius sediminis]